MLALAVGVSTAWCDNKIVIQTLNAVGIGSGFKTPVTTSCPGGDICYALSGKISGTAVGSASFAANVNTVSGSYVNNGSGGTCTPASGKMTIQMASSDTIILGFVGTFCDVGATPQSPNVGPVTLQASYFVTGGSGRMLSNLNGNSGRGKGGAGTGLLIFSGDTDDGDVLVQLSGILEVSPKPQAI